MALIDIKSILAIHYSDSNLQAAKLALLNTKIKLFVRFSGFITKLSVLVHKKIYILFVQIYR